MYKKYNNSDRHHRGNDRTDRLPIKKYSKSLILIKSSVVALSIVLVTLLAAFFVVKDRRENSAEVAVGKDCEKVVSVKNAHEIESFAVQGDVIVVLTKKDSAGKQQIIRIGSACGEELNRIVF